MYADLREEKISTDKARNLVARKRTLKNGRYPCYCMLTIHGTMPGSKQAKQQLRRIGTAVSALGGYQHELLNLVTTLVSRAAILGSWRAGTTPPIFSVYGANHASAAGSPSSALCAVQRRPGTTCSKPWSTAVRVGPTGRKPKYDAFSRGACISSRQ